MFYYHHVSCLIDKVVHVAENTTFPKFGEDRNVCSSGVSMTIQKFVVGKPLLEWKKKALKIGDLLDSIATLFRGQWWTTKSVMLAKKDNGNEE